MKGVVQLATPIDRTRTNDSDPLQDAEGVTVYRKGVAPEAVEQNTTRPLPRKPWQASQDSLRVIVL